MLVRDRTGMKGQMSWKVFEHSATGLQLLHNLKDLFLAGKITSVQRDERRQVILDDPKLSWIKHREPKFLEKLFGREALMAGVNHNIVTNEGDALIADHMTETDARTLVDTTNGHIEVGTGFTSEAKTVTSCVTPTGSPEVMDATYPKLKGTWGNTDDNVAQYRATFEAGDLNASGIDEACLLNNAVAATGDAMAYAEITTPVTVGASDTLQVDWEITYVGA